eukprot:gene48247-40645_t
MARFFIPQRWARGVFNTCVYMHFVVVLTAYAVSA